jgi:DUF4097 and DUF4098 domain-containing protein YvlB
MKLSSLLCTTMVLAAASPALAQDTWTWRKAVPAGRTIEIKGVNGDIAATAASGSEVEVVAKKSAKKSNPDNVKIQVVEHEGGVTICALYPSPRGREPNECLPGAQGRMNTRNDDTTVDFEVRVPRNVAFTGRTVNGGVTASGITADAAGHTVNGGVRVSTTGLAHASTVNGSIQVRMGKSDWTDELSFSTVNGGITLELPTSLETNVEASTVNGSFTSDWPLTVKGRFGPRRVSGKIGNGGRDLELSTVNGDIEIRKSN